MRVADFNRRLRFSLTPKRVALENSLAGGFIPREMSSCGFAESVLNRGDGEVGQLRHKPEPEWHLLPREHDLLPSIGGCVVRALLLVDVVRVGN